jgi:lipoprotein-releasing system ATP-binding protein
MTTSGSSADLTARLRSASRPGGSSSGVDLSEPPLVEARHVWRTLQAGDGPARPVLRDISLSVPRGEFVALTGPSGSGKSTLLYLLGALDRQTSGEIWLDGVEMGALDDDDRARFRSEKLGFVFQFHFLLPEFTVLENVYLPIMRRGNVRIADARDRAYEALTMLGLGEHWGRRPGQLSGGQQQRVSIARAVANDPAIILADEPTGSLDSKNAALVFDIFKRLVAEQGRTILMVTHDPGLASRTGRQFTMKDGRIAADEKREMFRDWMKTLSDEANER